jgi:hypothetical protein
MARNSKSLARKYNMRPFGITVAMPGGDIRYIELEFKFTALYLKMKLGNY